jgi:hypothetical protein
MRDEAFEFRAKNDAIVPDPIIKWFDADVIAGSE